MSKRLQVLVPDEEMAEIRRLARSERLTVGAWVRRTLRQARMRRSVLDRKTKLKSIREAAHYSFPTADIDQVLREIERGYGH
jgi:hypothetical protein